MGSVDVQREDGGCEEGPSFWGNLPLAENGHFLILRTVNPGPPSKLLCRNQKYGADFSCSLDFCVLWEKTRPD
jgi:hypothetical protein